MNAKKIRVGGASGYWGESDMATPQLLEGGRLDYLVFDYLAEVTMSIMARARAADLNRGYALDFVSSVLRQNLVEIARQNIKVISNAGGVNPEACGQAIRELVEELGLDLKVAVVTGDEVLDRLCDGNLGSAREMFSGAPVPASEKLMSANAYLGAFPIAVALGKGADIVVTGRCVDSAVTLGACIHEFGWGTEDFDALSGGSLAGHVIECGPQATGGNFTDWEDFAEGIANIGYPVAEIYPDGGFCCDKPEGTGGGINVGTVSEQIVYEIGDPQAYLLPDVVCDFSQVTVVQEGKDRVRVCGALGYPAPETYKVCATYMDGFRCTISLAFTGLEASKKVKLLTDAALIRIRQKLRAMNVSDFEDVNFEILGIESQYGAFSKIADGAREVVGRLAVKHCDQKVVGLLIKEVMGIGLAAPAGFSGFGGGKPKPSPVVRLFSCLVPKEDITVSLDFGDGPQFVEIPKGTPFDPSKLERPGNPAHAPDGETVEVPLVKLAWGRSGDKGDNVNIGIIARKPEYLPYIAATLTEDVVAGRFEHFLDGTVTRFVMPGLNALNFLLCNTLGGGGTASLRSDPQGKAFAQILLDHPITVPADLAKAL